MEFLNSRRPDLEIRANFFHQLTELETKLAQMGQGASSSTWDLEDNKNPDVLLLRNTFLNAKNAPIVEIYKDFTKLLRNSCPRMPIKLQWVEDNKKNNLLNSSIGNYSKIKIHKNFVKSILKGSNKMFEKKNEILSSSFKNNLNNERTDTNKIEFSKTFSKEEDK